MGLIHPPDISPQDWYDALVSMEIFVYLHGTDSYSRADSYFWIVDADLYFKELMPTRASGS